MKTTTCPPETRIGDTVTVADGASKWMRERGFWIDEWPESIDGMTFTVVADYTDLSGDSAHWWLETDEVKDCGVNPQFILPTPIVDHTLKAGCAPLPCSAGCSKCGSSDIHRKYYAQGDDTNGPWPNRKGKSSEWVNRKDAYFQPAMHECIVHTCRCCGYSWDSDSLPNVKSGGTAPPGSD